MPNTLAHIGAQVLITRSVTRSADLRWVLIGCVVPDLPWILNRAAIALLPGLDVLSVRPYWIAQASLLGSLWLCGALALLASRPRRAFALLAGNALAHLLLDALQTKWGNGVHVLAPLDWHTWNLGLFWPESIPTWTLTALGAGGAVYVAFDVRRRRWELIRPNLARATAMVGLVAVYFAYPLLVTDAVVRADANSLETLRHPELRSGRRAGFDRVWLEVTESGSYLHVLGGERLEARGRLMASSGPVSARGRFLSDRVIELDSIHRHGEFPRALASYLGLAAIGIVLASGLRPHSEADAGAEEPTSD